MKVIITIQEELYEHPISTVIERHHGHCRVLDIILLIDKYHILCDFDIPDENTASRKWLYPFYNNYIMKWQTIHKETAWDYNMNMSDWISLKLTHQFSSLYK
jgi:hypothetical protein